MNEAELNQICPEDVLLLLQRAEQIPDGSKVSKKTGTQEFTLRHDLKVYPISVKKGEEPNETIEIKGFFLVNGHGNVNQIKPTQELHWHIRAENLHDYFTDVWELDRDPDDDK